MCAEWFPVFSPDDPYMLPMARLFMDLIEVQFLSLDIAGWLSLLGSRSGRDEGELWLGQGLQHRTWELPLTPARVLCCSQWNCCTVHIRDGTGPSRSGNITSSYSGFL
ncbi:unnamed protein product [Leuciscus chuanchicus]